MVVYVDVLVFVNTLVNFLIISLTEKLMKSKTKLWRTVLGAFVSALFSLYIFLPEQNFFIELLMRLSSSIFAVAIAFSFKSFKSFLSHLLCFYGVSFVYSGIIIAICMLFNPNTVAVNNGIVYFDISPLGLITLSFIIYLLIILYKKITKKDNEFAKRCTVVLYFDGITVETVAMVDTGHSLYDPFGGKPVIIVDKSVSNRLFGLNLTEQILKLSVDEGTALKLKIKAILIQTVNGQSVLSAVKIDKAFIVTDKNKNTVESPVLAISNANLGEDYSAIIPPEFLIN